MIQSLQLELWSARDVVEMRVDIPAGPMAGGAPSGMGRTPDLSAEVTVKRETFWRLLWGMVRRPGATLPGSTRTAGGPGLLGGRSALVRP
jgi:hypothetical protein